MMQHITTLSGSEWKKTFTLFLSAFTRWLSHTFPAPQLCLLELFAACSLGEVHPSQFSWASFMVHGTQGNDFTMSGSGSFCNANLFPGAGKECHLALLKQLLVFREECWAAVACLRGALNHQLIIFTQHLEPACCYKEWGVSVNSSSTERTGAATTQLSKEGIIY